MVMYEAGFKCPACAKSRPSHAQKVTSVQYAVAILGALAMGYGYGFLNWGLLAFLPFRPFGIPVLAFLVAYGLGVLGGHLLQKGLRYRLNHWLVLAVALSAALGLLVNPGFMGILRESIQVAMAPQDDLLMGSSSGFYFFAVFKQGFAAFLFVRGLCRPFFLPI